MNEEEMLPEVRAEVIKGILTKEFEGHREPDVLFAYSGGITKKGKGERYRSTSFSDVIEHGLVTGGRTRVIATEEISKVLSDIEIVATSRYQPDQPTHASVIKGELVRRGVDPDRISLEEESMSTATQLVEMVKMAVDKDWERIAVMTNDYHRPRMSEMYKRLDTIIDNPEFQGILQKYKEKGTEVSFIAAEEILTQISGHFKSYLAKVREMPEFQRTVASEAKGLEDLKAGRYKIRYSPIPRNE